MDSSPPALADPDRRLRLYRETAGVMLLLLDRAGRVREINRKGCELLGFRERDLVGRDWFATCLPAAARAASRAAFDRLFAARNGETQRRDEQLVTRDGRICNVAWQLAPLRDSTGRVVGVLGSGEDVSERGVAAALLERLSVGTSGTVGESYLRGLVRELVVALDASCAVVGRVDEAGERLQVLASWPADDFFDSFVLPLAGSPLAPGLDGDVRVLESSAASHFPADPLLARYRAEALLSLALRAPDTRLLGVLAVLHDRPRAAPAMAQAVLRLLGARAAAELERLRTERALFAAKELAEITLQSIGDAVITTDPEGWVTELNPAAERLLGWPRAEAIGLSLRSILRLVDEGTGEPLPDPVEACFREGGPVAMPPGTLLLARDGSQHGVSDTAAPIRDRDGSVMGAVVVFQDVTEARRLARTLAYRASHDLLTGLLNRGELERRLESARQDAAREEVQHAFCYIDLDQFKLVNDLCGHQAGDELLRQLARLLQRRVRTSDVLARLGGDEFGLLLPGCPLERAQEIAEGICRAVREFRFAWQGRAFELGASVGVVPVTAATESTTWLLSRADIACYAAKDLGRNRVFVDREGDPELLRRHLELSHLSGLLAGLEEGRFSLAFQPIVPLAATDRKGRSHHGPGLAGEVLLRWMNGDGELVSASGIIPAAERFNLMATVDQWVVTQALRFFGRQLAGGLPISAVALNLSSNTLADGSFVDRVRDLLAETRFPAERVWFEITETAAVNDLGQAVELMGRLRELGCRFALDDFGSGLSSFTLLRSMPIDLLKIDGSFVRGMETDPVDRAVVEATTGVARAMGLATVAEWVERRELLVPLRALGIDYAQGFAIGPPVPLASLAPPLADRAELPA